jgi:hypothetical protein
MTSDSVPTGRAWTLPEDIYRRLRRRWDTGELLTSFTQGVPWSPWSMSIRGPSTADLAADYATVQEWLRAWRTPHDALRIEYKRLGGRTIGANTIPGRAWVDSYEQLWALLGVACDVTWFTDALRATRERLPRIADWMRTHPTPTLAHRQVWTSLIDTVHWIEQNPAPVYVRQVDVSGVDTKFIDTYKGILTSLLEAQLDSTRIDRTVGPSDFAGRFGFLRKASYVRFRHLDPEPPTHGFSELTVRLDEFTAAPERVDAIYVVENETTYLAFPSMRRSMVVFGGGYAVAILQGLGWLAEHPLFYWGDIDTHGFTILNRVRQRFPHTRSLLMNVGTLLAHERHWVTEASPSIEALEHLTGDEADLYRDIIEGTYGPSVRLEQERIRFSFVHDALTGPHTPALDGVAHQLS